MQIGISPMSWGVSPGKNPLNVTWSQFLDEVVVAGYEGIELGAWGYLPTDPDRLSNELVGRGLLLAGGQLNSDFTDGDAWPAVKERTKATCELLNQLGATRLVLLSTYGVTSSPEAAQRIRSEHAAWPRMIERIQDIARIAQERGVVAAYHPHAGGGIESENEVERFLADTDPGLVFLCFDTGHHAYCGGDVTRFIRDHGDRISHIHLKNVNRQIRDRALREDIPFSAAARLGVMTDLELGLIDFAAVREALIEIAYAGWAVVEQDRNQTSADAPLAIAARNRQFLRRLEFHR